MSPHAVSPHAVSPHAVSPHAVSPLAVSPHTVAPHVVSLIRPSRREASTTGLEKKTLYVCLSVVVKV